MMTQQICSAHGRPAIGLFEPLKIIVPSNQRHDLRLDDILTGCRHVPTLFWLHDDHHQRSIDIGQLSLFFNMFDFVLDEEGK